jgi:hypothetical protein
MCPKRTLLALLALGLLPVVSACGTDSVPLVPEAESLTTFDNGLGPWIPLDLGLAAGSSFTVSEESGAARFEMDVAAAGGEGVLAREVVLTPGVEYVVFARFLFETSDAPGIATPWRLVVGTSVEGGPWDFNSDLDTGAGAGILPQTIRISGDLSVTAGAATGPNDSSSEVRVAIGLRPTSADQRSYAIDEILLQFIPADQIG